MNTDDHECIIGLYYWNLGDVGLITFSQLKKKINDDKCLYRDIKYDPIYASIYHSIKHYTLKDYADKRKSTDLNRFDYCPMCGKKIDWKKMGRDDIVDSN